MDVLGVEGGFFEPPDPTDGGTGKNRCSTCRLLRLTSLVPRFGSEHQTILHTYIPALTGDVSTQE